MFSAITLGTTSCCFMSMNVSNQPTNIVTTIEQKPAHVQSRPFLLMKYLQLASSTPSSSCLARCVTVWGFFARQSFASTCFSNDCAVFSYDFISIDLSTAAAEEWKYSLRGGVVVVDVAFFHNLTTARGRVWLVNSLLRRRMWTHLLLASWMLMFAFSFKASSERGASFPCPDFFRYGNYLKYSMARQDASISLPKLTLRVQYCGG